MDVVYSIKARSIWEKHHQCVNQWDTKCSKGIISRPVTRRGRRTLSGASKGPQDAVGGLEGAAGRCRGPVETST